VWWEGVVGGCAEGVDEAAYVPSWQA
jgi:hypothetical protein